MPDTNTETTKATRVMPIAQIESTSFDRRRYASDDILLRMGLDEHSKTGRLSLTAIVHTHESMTPQEIADFLAAAEKAIGELATKHLSRKVIRLS